MIVPGRFNSGSAKFNIEFDDYMTDRNRFKTAMREFKTVPRRFNVQLLPKWCPLSMSHESREVNKLEISIAEEMLIQNYSATSSPPWRQHSVAAHRHE